MKRFSYFLLLIMLFTSFNAEAVDLKFAGCLTIFDSVLKEAKQIFESKTGYKIGVSEVARVEV